MVALSCGMYINTVLNHGLVSTWTQARGIFVVLREASGVDRGIIHTLLHLRACKLQKDMEGMESFYKVT